MLDHPDVTSSHQDPPGSPARPSGDAGESRLPRRALQGWHATTLATALPACAVIIVAAVWWGDPIGLTLMWVLLGLITALALLDLAVINRVRHRGYSYTVSDDAVYIAKGALVRHTVDLAVPQVLSVHVIRGPVHRALGLASVRFVSVVDGESLGPVDVVEAERIKQVVLRGLERRRQESAPRPAHAGQAPA